MGGSSCWASHWGDDEVVNVDGCGDLDYCCVESIHYRRESNY